MSEGNLPRLSTWLNKDLNFLLLIAGTDAMNISGLDW